MWLCVKAIKLCGQGRARACVAETDLLLLRRLRLRQVRQVRLLLLLLLRLPPGSWRDGVIDWVGGRAATAGAGSHGVNLAAVRLVGACFHQRGVFIL